MRNAIVFLTLSLGLASGQARTPQERQEILDYNLTLPRANQLITAMEAMTKYVVSLPDWQTRMAGAMKKTRSEQRADLEKDPKGMAILKQNGLTAQEYMVGVPALRAAIWLASGRTGNPNLVASPANLAFAKANLAELKPKLDAADGLPAARK